MTSTNEWVGKQIVVTGAGGGLGPAVVDAFVAAGASCHLPTRDPSAGPARDRVRVVTGVDLTDEASVRGFFASLPSVWASVHVAGGFAAKPLLSTTLTDWRQQLDINLTTAFLTCREAARAMGEGGGRIVNVSSRAANAATAGTLAYSVSKAAVSHLTRCLAEELRPRGVLVNAIAPSIIDTPANRAAMPKADFSHWPKPAELAQTILWLASPLNTVTSGEIVPVYGAA